MPDIPAELATQLKDKLGAGDLGWVESSYKSGALDWVKDHVAAADWTELPKRIVAKDLAWIRNLLGGLDLPGIGKLGGAGAAATVAGTTATKKRGWWWLLPALVVIGLLAWLLSRCGSDEKATAPTTAPATTVAPAATAAVTTAAATTTAAPTTTVAATTTAAPTTTTTAAPALGDLLDVAGKAGRFTTLVKLLGDAGLTDVLKGAGPYTVFAPTDDAFKKLSAADLDALAKDPDALRAVLTGHGVGGSLKAADLKAGVLRSLAGTDLTLTIAGGKVTINGLANVTTADVAAKNGTIHVIDAVLVAPKTPLPTVE